jgi:hypothetical protein
MPLSYLPNVTMIGFQTAWNYANDRGVLGDAAILCIFDSIQLERKVVNVDVPIR